MNASSEDLGKTKTDTWHQLELAVSNPQNPLRYLTLCTIDEHSKPQARILVLRHAITKSRQLIFHTDARSAKWQQLEKCDSVTVVGYDPEQRLQLRFKGKAKLYDYGKPEHSVAWEQLSETSKQAYSGPPPGEQISQPADTIDSGELKTDSNATGDSSNFGVIEFHAHSLDWFEHKSSILRRASHNFKESESEDISAWINP